jgi:hypothetical protein
MGKPWLALAFPRPWFGQTYGSDIGGTLVTQLEALDVLAECGNSTDGFVSGDQRERRLETAGYQ